MHDFVHHYICHAFVQRFNGAAKMRGKHHIQQRQEFLRKLRLVFMTSRPAPAIFPIFNARKSVGSSITGPRDVLITNADGSSGKTAGRFRNGAFPASFVGARNNIGLGQQLFEATVGS